MFNPAQTQRVLRPEGSSTATHLLRRSSHAQGHTGFSGFRQPHGLKSLVTCNSQSFGRGQPPNQPQPMSLVRRPFYDPMQAAYEPMQPTFIKLSDVMERDVISATTGRKLGKLGEAWVDASRLEVTCFDLEYNGVVGVVPLLTIKQAGDVVLVQEDGVLRQPLDTRFGFTKLLGWEVRTPSNRALGKVRDMSFSRETGTISKVEFDDFGLRFLRADFFDRYSVPADAIRQCAYGVVSLVADNVQYQEKQGLLSGLLRRVGGAQQLAGLLADGSRGNEAAGLLPQGYSYEQWQNDVRMWEAQTGCSYEEYMLQSGQQQPYRRNALPPGRAQPQALLPEARQPAGGSGGYALPPPSSSAGGGVSRSGGYGSPMAAPQQPQQPYGAAGQQQGMSYGAGYGAGYTAGGGGGTAAADPRFRAGSAAQPPARGAPAQARYPSLAGPQQPQPQQQQWPQPGAQPQAGQQQPQWGQQQWSQPPPQQASMPQQQPQQPVQPSQQQPLPQQQRPMGGVPPGRGPAAGPGVGVATGPQSPLAAGPVGGAMQMPQMQPMQQQLQQPMQQQYAWPGATPGPAEGTGIGPAAGRDIGQAAPVPGQSGAGAGAGRVEEWVARGQLQGQPPLAAAAAGGYEPVMEAPGRTPAAPGPAAPAQQAIVADTPGWDLPSGAASRQPY